MDAELCRLLSRAPSTAYFQQEGPILPKLLDVDLGDRPLDGSLREWLIEQGIEAYSLDKMHPLVQGFLKDCDRCWQIEDELIIENPRLTIEERHKQALAFLEKEQEVVS